jgi:hypothetical protein
MGGERTATGLEEGPFSDTLTIYKGEAVIDSLGITEWVNAAT